MNLDTTIDRAITTRLLTEREADDHKPSGKLSAGMLAKPLQWQLLHTLGVPARPLEEYALRYFKRGKDIETWVCEFLPGLVEQQKFLTYRGAVGYADAVVNTSDYEWKVGTVPFEIKSVKNSKYRRIRQQTAPDHGHLLQGAFYALAMKAEHFGIVYLAADDLRVTNYIIPVALYKREIDKIINEYVDALRSHVIPEFQAREDWQAKPQFCDYPEWLTLTQKEVMAKLQAEYPEAYRKLAVWQE